MKNGLGKCLCWRNIWISIFLLFHKKPVITFQPWPCGVSLPDYQLIGHWNRTFDWKIHFCAGYEGQNKSEVNLARLGKKYFWCEIFKSLPNSKIEKKNRAQEIISKVTFDLEWNANKWGCDNFAILELILNKYRLPWISKSSIANVGLKIDSKNIFSEKEIFLGMRFKLNLLKFLL